MKPAIDPPETAELLWWASRTGFTTHIVGPVDNPLVLVLARFVGDYIDIAHVRGADRTEVARIPRDEHANIWQPERVTFHYYGDVLTALQALRRLPHPGRAAAPRTPYQPPRDSAPTPLTVKDTERATTTTRPPSTNREGGTPMT